MISIIVNCYNLEKYITAAIRSLLDQQYTKDYEIIVINDASTDNSLKLLQQFNDQKLIILDLPQNKGAQYGVELAFSKARGNYICRFDGDDVWSPDFLRKASEILDHHPEISMVYSDVAFIDSDGHVISEKNNINRRLKEQPVLENEFVDILKEYYINAPTIMFRKEAFAKAFPLPSVLKNFIDFYISLKVLETGKAWFINEPLAYYRLHPNNGHKLVVQNRNNEHVTEFILNDLVLTKKNLPKTTRKNLTAINYFRLGNDYFGARMFEDAKKYYLKTFAYNPAYLLKGVYLKRLASTLLGHSAYLKTRNLIRKAV